jgi:hypothetical protein
MPAREFVDLFSRPYLVNLNQNFARQRKSNANIVSVLDTFFHSATSRESS